MSDEWNLDLKAGEFQLALDPHGHLDHILLRNQNRQITNEERKEVLNTCFNKRIVDGFLINAARAIFHQNLPEKLPEGKRNRKNVMKIDELKDCEDIFFLLQVVGYYHMILSAKNKTENDKTHRILANLKRCREITEQYFQGNWNSHGTSLKTKILEKESPDFAIIKEIEEILDEVEYNEIDRDFEVEKGI